ncbi:MAG: response regulator [Saprospiraceae bacterium]|nr:response regulator [Saprospiraceae bacterium]
MSSPTYFRLLWAAALILAQIGPLSAQNGYADIEQLQTEQGLPSGYITSLLQDRQGFLWVGTLDGLCRFDGHQFKVFKHDEEMSNSLPGNMVETLFEDRNGTLWVGSSGGLSRYLPEQERFVSYQHQPEDSTSIALSNVLSIYEDAAGMLWILTMDGGLQEMDPERGVFRSYAPQLKAADQNGFLMAPVFHPDPLRRGYLWIPMSLDGRWTLYAFNTADKTFRPCVSDSLASVQFVWNITTDKEGLLWLATNNGLRVFDPNTMAFTGLEAFHPAIKSMSRKKLFSTAIDRAGQIWVGTTTEGVYVLNKKRGIVAHYDQAGPAPASLSGNMVKPIFEDRFGTVWVGTFGQGLNRISLRQPVFRHGLPDKNGSNSGKNIIDAIAESASGQIWLGGQFSGLWIFDPQSGQIQQAGAVYPALDVLKKYLVSALCQTRDGAWWIGFNTQGLGFFDPKQQQLHIFLNQAADTTSPSSNYITSLLEDRQGRLWAGTTSGLDRYDPQTGGFVHYRINDPDAAGQAPCQSVSSLLEDRLGNIWAGASCGLGLVDVQKNNVRLIHPEKNGPSPGKTLNVRSIFQDHQGVYWVSTDKGLYRLSFPNPAAPLADQPQVRRYTASDGLPNQYVFSVLEDARGQIWIYTSQGLAVFRNPRHDAASHPDFKNYDRRDGFTNQAVSNASWCKTRSGMFFLGGRNGFNWFHPDSLRNDPYRPSVVITAFEKFDTGQPETGAIAEKGISVASSVHLTHRNNIFTIEFAALDYRDPGKHRFAYRLLGFNDTWVQLGTQRRVTFTNLDPGRYTFQVRATNSDGIWNDTPTALDIIVHPPWWKTWWAYAAYLALFVGGIYGFVRLRLRVADQRAQELEQAVQTATGRIRDQNRQLALQAESLRALDEVKSRFFANVSHELRTPLTLLLGPLNSVLLRKRQAPEDRHLLEIAQKSGQNLLQLVGELLNLGKLEAGKLTLEETPVALQPLLLRLGGNFDSYAQRLGLQYTIHCQLPPETTVLLDRKKFETVFNNLLSNALKFTPSGGTVQVRLEPGNNTNLRLVVQDSGRGIHPDDLPHVFERYFQSKQAHAPAEGGTGIGLALCSEYARLFGGQLGVDSEWGKGSRFFFEFPATATAPEPESLPDSPAAADSPLRPAPRLPAPAAGAEKARLLIVEDNEHLQAFLEAILSPEYEQVAVANGVEALQQLEEGFAAGKLPDLILSDVMMPVMDGFQLLEALKQDHRYAHIPVVMLTALADETDKLRALRIGVDEYLLKPFEETELLARLRNLLRNARTRPGRPVDPAQAAARRILAEEQAWLATLEQLVLREVANFQLSAELLASQLNMSRPTLFRRMKQLTGLTVQQYIVEVRFRVARQGLEQGRFSSVKAAALSVGLKDAAHFAQLFQERFGKPPAAYL